MAMRMGFCIRSLEPGVGRKYLANKDGNWTPKWVDGGDQDVRLWSTNADAEEFAKSIKTPTEVVPYVDRPLMRPDPDRQTLKKAYYNLRDAAEDCVLAGKKLDPMGYFGTALEYDKLPEQYCRVLAALNAATNLLNAAKIITEEQPSREPMPKYKTIYDGPEEVDDSKGIEDAV